MLWGHAFLPFTLPCRQASTATSPQILPHQQLQLHCSFPHTNRCYHSFQIIQNVPTLLLPFLVPSIVFSSFHATLDFRPCLTYDSGTLYCDQHQARIERATIAGTTIIHALFCVSNKPPRACESSAPTATPFLAHTVTQPHLSTR